MNIFCIKITMFFSVNDTSTHLKTVKEKMALGGGFFFVDLFQRFLNYLPPDIIRLNFFLGPMVNRIFCRASPPSLDYGAAFFHIEQWRSRLDPAGKPLYSVKIRFTSHVHLHQKNLKKIHSPFTNLPKKIAVVTKQ